jgi:hypothetical protein
MPIPIAPSVARRVDGDERTAWLPTVTSRREPS